MKNSNEMNNEQIKCLFNGNDPSRVKAVIL